jgi:NodT family efflux transporter outer membrane factor (OMF) lipoprotein
MSTSQPLQQIAFKAALFVTVAGVLSGCASLGGGQSNRGDTPSTASTASASTASARSGGGLARSVGSFLPGRPRVPAQDVSAISAFRDAPPAPSGQSAQWWARFADPVLDKLVREALNESLTVQQAEARVIEARGQGRATIAGFAPRLTATASTETTYATSGPDLQNVNGGTESSQGTSSVGARASWELPLFGRFGSALAGARAGEAGALMDVEAAKVAVIGDLAAAYIELRNAQLSLAWLEEDLARANRLVQIAEARQTVGLLSVADAGQAKGEAAQVRGRLPDARLRVRASLDRIAILRGLVPGQLDQELAPVANFDFRTEAPEVTSVPAEFVRRRLDVRRAEQNAILASAEVGISKAELYPSVSITGAINTIAAIAGGPLTQSVGRGSVSPAISLPLFDLGARRAQVRVSNARFDQALATYRLTTLSAVAEGQQALTSYSQGRERVSAALASERATQVRFTATNRAFEEGLLSFQDRLEAERALAAARQSRLAAQAQASDAAIGLYRTFAGAPGL